MASIKKSSMFTKEGRMTKKATYIRNTMALAMYGSTDKLQSTIVEMFKVINPIDDESVWEEEIINPAIEMSREMTKSDKVPEEIKGKNDFDTLTVIEISLALYGTVFLPLQKLIHEAGGKKVDVDVLIAEALMDNDVVNSIEETDPSILSNIDRTLGLANKNLVRPPSKSQMAKIFGGVALPVMFFVPKLGVSMWVLGLVSGMKISQKDPKPFVRLAYVLVDDFEMDKGLKTVIMDSMFNIYRQNIKGRDYNGPKQVYEAFLEVVQEGENRHLNIKQEDLDTKLLENFINEDGTLREGHAEKLGHLDLSKLSKIKGKGQKTSKGMESINKGAIQPNIAESTDDLM